MAVLASIFTRPGVYASPSLFVDGFKAALWVGAGFAVVGVLIALSVRQRPRRADGPAHAEPALAGNAG